MRAIRQIDWDAADVRLDGGYLGQVLFNGESCHIIATLVPPGASGPPLHVHRSDQLYFVVEGALEIDLGTDTRTAIAGQGVFIPSGLPHQNRNSGPEVEVHIEVIAPGIAPTSPLAVPVADRAPNGLEAVVRSPSKPSNAGPFAMSWLVSRRLGSRHASIYVADMAPGASGPPTHVHDFDQFYFVLSGSLHVEVGLQEHVVGPNTLVVLPSGVPHRQWNPSGEPERHLAILVPEPEQPNSAEHRWDTVVDFAVAARQLD